MSFDLDAFISYAHIDNQPLTAGEKGWVTQFHATLQTMLSQRLGQPARIWRDDKLAGNDVFAGEIVDQFEKTAMLVSILSPRYLRSEWCTRELREFCEAAMRNGGVAVGNTSRVLKVVKMPVGANAVLPEAVQKTLGYEFFALDGNTPKELDPAYGPEWRQQFLSKLSSLAWELSESLHRLEQALAAGQAVEAPPSRAAVFLADCGSDMRDIRRQLETELRMHGHPVLPAEQSPLAEGALAPAIEAQLERCALSIHLVGRSVGPVPDGPSGRSLAMLENRLAVERCRRGPLRRIIWLPEGISGERAEQQAFIAALENDAAEQYGADLLRGDVEALKGAMHEILRQIETPAVAQPVVAADRPVVHLLPSAADRSAAVPLIKLLRTQGVEVSMPLFSGDAAAMREANARLACDCDALILFYGAGDETWKFHQSNELRKQAASRSDCRRRSEWLCLAAPSTDDKALQLQLEEPRLINALAGFTLESLQPLLAALKAGS